MIIIIAQKQWSKSRLLAVSEKKLIKSEIISLEILFLCKRQGTEKTIILLVVFRETESKCEANS